MPIVYISGCDRQLTVAPGTKLLHALRQSGIHPDAPCGGNGTCGKCRVLVDGTPALACRTTVEKDMTVDISSETPLQVLQAGIDPPRDLDPLQPGPLLALDIGTTTVVCYLLHGSTGQELAKSSMQNPQAAFGADVISRLRAALQGHLEQLTQLIRQAVATLAEAVCRQAGIHPETIGVVSVVGNPAMQQLFLGICPENLTKLPFSPVLTEAKAIPCGDILPLCPRGTLLIVPNISGFVGADTLGCLLATKLYEQEQPTLLVDIGTNGEMVLGNRDRMIACATAAGPALEGANIRCGMGARDGAIDHVWLEDGAVQCSVIGGGEARGICGSGLLDAVAVGLQLGLIDQRGRILTEDRILHLTPSVHLTQEDIRQVQLAKGAICAGILLMARQLGIRTEDIHRVQLAGAFGSFVNPESACRVGLLPEVLLPKIEAVGNAAGSGAKMLSCDQKLLPLTQVLAEKIEFLELASLPDFPRTFARAMRLREEQL